MTLQWVWKVKTRCFHMLFPGKLFSPCQIELKCQWHSKMQKEDFFMLWSVFHTVLSMTRLPYTQSYNEIDCLTFSTSEWKMSGRVLDPVIRPREASVSPYSVKWHGTRGSASTDVKWVPRLSRKLYRPWSTLKHSSRTPRLNVAEQSCQQVGHCLSRA